MITRKTIKIGQIGIVTKEEKFARVLNSGKHWLNLWENAMIFSKFELYELTNSIRIMIEDSSLKEEVEIIDIKDNEIALQYIDEKFFDVLTTGKYYYFKGLLKTTFTIVDLSKIDIKEVKNITSLKNTTLVSYIRSFKVNASEEGLLFVDGKYDRKLKQGTHYFWKSNHTLEMQEIDLRQQQVELSGQEILTKDKAGLRVNFYAQYNVVDTEKALLNAQDYTKQLYIMLQLALREFVGMQTLDELLDNKNEVSAYIIDSLKSKLNKIGIEIESTGIRDVILPGEMKEIMNKVLISQKQAQANIIMRREETASTRSLLNTAKLMEDNEMLFKLKEMEYVEKIADKIGAITLAGNGQVVDQLKGLFSK